MVRDEEGRKPFRVGVRLQWDKRPGVPQKAMPSLQRLGIRWRCGSLG